MSPRLTPRGRLGAALLALSALLTAGASPAAAQAVATENPADIQVVVTTTSPSLIDGSGWVQTPGVLTVRLKNNGARAWTPTSPDATMFSGTGVQFSTLGDANLSFRSFYGWQCDVTYGWSCSLTHTIEPGQFSLPIEVEIAPRYQGTTYQPVDVQATSYSSEGKRQIEHATPEGTLIDEPDYGLSWSEDGIGDHPRAPRVTATASTTAVSGTDTFTVGLAATSATNISTGPFNDWTQSGGLGAGRFWHDGHRGASECAQFPTPALVLTLPSDAVELVSLKGFRPAPETVATEVTGRSGSALDPTVHGDEIELFEGEDYFTEGGGVYTVRFRSPTRFLPNNPWRFVATLRLKSGVQSATMSVDAEALPQVDYSFCGESSRTAAAGRAIFSGPNTSTASVTVSRATPPAPDAGGVLAQDVSPVLVGRARFAADAIRVGRTTKVNVTVTNNGNGASVAGRVCVRFTSHLVIVKKPKGVTQKGLLLCAPTPAIAVGQTITAAKGIVVRGVRTTDEARVRDGANDGVAVTGDVLEIFGQQLRAGGVTG